MSKVKIKQLFEEDWQSVKFIRLASLQQSAGVFLSSYDMEVKTDEETWRSQLRIKNGAIFGLFDNKKVIGLTGVFTWRGDETGKTAILAMSFIDKDYRGKGYAKLFYDARIAWARQQGCFDKIRVSHRAGNEASRAANQAFGFKYIGKEMIDWTDGTKDFEYNYELKLRR